jgi:hypothetical protein
MSVGVMPSYVGEFLMPENLSGTVQSVTSITERTPATAPATASYFRIVIRYLSQLTTYYVYLGGNQTDDFNIRRGMHYHYSMTLRGRNPSDIMVKMTVGPTSGQTAGLTVEPTFGLMFRPIAERTAEPISGLTAEPTAGL